MTHCKDCGGIKLANGEVWSGSAANFCQCSKSMQGWECPRCHTIHSPFKMSCNCVLPTITGNCDGNLMNRNKNVN